MFKNLKQKLENLSATSPPDRNTSISVGGKESIERPTDLMEGDDSGKQTTLSVQEKDRSAISAFEPQEKTTTVSETKPDSMTDQPAHVPLNQSGKSLQDSGISDWTAKSGEELAEKHLELEKTNRVLLGQVKNLGDSKDELDRKFRRRIGELEEQISLDKQAKRDLEHSYALMLDEKDELITVLKTQVQLLKSNHPIPTAPVDLSEDLTTSTVEPSDSPITLEELGLLKEKVKRLESLLTKCKETIKSNKEKTRQLTQEKEELKKECESKLDELRLKHEKELKSKVSDLQEEIRALSEVRSGLNNQLVQLTSELSEKEKVIEVKEKDFNAQMEKVKKDTEKLSSSLKNHESSQKASKGEDVTEIAVATGEAARSEELKEMKEMYELRSKELIQILEDRNRLRKELASQRQRFALVLERYDEQMKVVQGDLIESLKPGAIEIGLTAEVQAILTGDQTLVDGSEAGDASYEKTTDIAESEKNEAGEQDPSLESVSDAGTASAYKPDMVPRQELEAAETKMGKVLVLLERCAKQADSREAREGRWRDRLTEAENKSATQLRESQETITILNNQIMELTNRENVLNMNLERARQQSEAILQQQTAEMAALQSTIEQLLDREGHLKGQMQKTKMTCESEVARVTAENMESIQNLTDMFQENQQAVADLSGQLMQSKEQSDGLIYALESDLDEKCRMLQATADFIEASGDSSIKSAFMKIILECSGSAGVPVEGANLQAGGSDGTGQLAPGAPSAGEVANDSNGELNRAVQENDNVSAENCKLSLTAEDKKEVKIEFCNQQKIIDFDFPPIKSQPEKPYSRQDSRVSLPDIPERDSKVDGIPPNSELITRLCSRKSFASSPSKSVVGGKMETCPTDLGHLVASKTLERELEDLKMLLSETRQRCERLETENASLVTSCQKLSRVEERVESQTNLGTDSTAPEVSGRGRKSAPEEGTGNPIELDRKLKEAAKQFEISQENVKRLEEINSKLELESTESTERLTMDINATNKRVIDLQDENRSLQETLYRLGTDANAKIEGLTKRNAELESNCKRLGKFNAELEQLLLEKSCTIVELEQIQMECEGLRSRVVHLESETTDHKELKSRISVSSESDMDSLKLENSELKVKVEQYETVLREMHLLKDKLVKSEALHMETEQGCANVREELERMKDNLEKEKAKALLLEEEVKAMENVRLELKDSLEKRQTTQDEMSRVQEENEGLKGKLSECQLELKKEEGEKVKVREDGECFRESLEKEVLRTKSFEEQIKKYQDLEVEMENLKEVLTKQETSHKELLASLDDSLRDKETFMSVKNHLELKVESLRNASTELQVSLAALKASVELKDSENVSLLQELKFKDAELKEAVRMKETEMRGLKQMEDEVMQNKVMLSEVETKHSTLLGELDEAKKLIAHLEGKITILTDQSLSLNSEVGQKNRLLNLSFDSLSTSQVMLGRASSEILFLESRVQKLTDENSRLNGCLEDGRHKKDPEPDALTDNFESSDQNENKRLHEIIKSESGDEAAAGSILRITQELDEAWQKLKAREDEIKECEAEMMSGRRREEELLQELNDLRHQLASRNDEDLNKVLSRRSKEAERETHGDQGKETEHDKMSADFSAEGGGLFDGPRSAATDDKRLEHLRRQVEDFDLLAAANEMILPNVKEDLIEKVKVHYQRGSNSEAHPHSGMTDNPSRLSTELEKLRSLHEDSQREPIERASVTGSVKKETDLDAMKNITEDLSPPFVKFRREHFDSLDLSQDIFSTPEKSSPRLHPDEHPAFTCVDDHRRTFVDLSPLDDIETSGQKVESGTEKSDSDLLDVSDAHPSMHSRIRLVDSKHLNYEDLQRERHFLAREVDKLRSELHYYYANSHHQHHLQDRGSQDSFLDISEPTELEYLRNVLYKYMLGVETKTLAKVICTVVRFSGDQTKKVLDREDSRIDVFGPRK